MFGKHFVVFIFYNLYNKILCGNNNSSNNNDNN